MKRKLERAANRDDSSAVPASQRPDTGESTHDEGNVIDDPGGDEIETKAQRTRQNAIFMAAFADPPTKTELPVRARDRAQSRATRHATVSNELFRTPRSRALRLMHPMISLLPSRRRRTTNLRLRMN